MSKRIKDIPHYQRPREKLLEKGSINVHNEELLALLLGTGTKGQNVIDISKKILKQFPFNKDELPNIPDLKKIVGIGTTKACIILALYELVCRFSTPKFIEHVQQPDDVVCYASSIRAKHQEHVMVLYINARSQLIDKHIVAIGKLNHIQIEARDIFAPAFLKPCSGIIIVHNHPSNDCQPSSDDISFTKQILSAGKILGIELLDHIIVSKDHYYSMREHDHIVSST